MKQRILVFVLLIALAGITANSSAVAPPPDPNAPVKTALAKLQGEWKMRDNGKVPRTLTIKGNQWIERNAETGRVIMKANIKIDPLQNPAHIDMMWKEEILRKGIYKLEGNTLTVHAPGIRPQPPRPKNFKPKFPITLGVWIRIPLQ